MPCSISLYDGRNNEENKKGAISAWYYLMLEPPTPVTVYVFPVIAFLVVFGIGFLLHKNLKKNR